VTVKGRQIFNIHSLNDRGNNKTSIGDKVGVRRPTVRKYLDDPEGKQNRGRRKRPSKESTIEETIVMEEAGQGGDLNLAKKDASGPKMHEKYRSVEKRESVAGPLSVKEALAIYLRKGKKS